MRLGGIIIMAGLGALGLGLGWTLPTALAQQTAETSAGGAATTESGDPPTTQPESPQPSQQDILREMLRDGSTIQPLRPTKTAATQPANDQGAGVKLMPEHTVIARRVGRLTRQGEWWLFTFESDGKAMQDPPMRLLPCRWLETMETATDMGTRDIRFLMTGKVTEYHGQNYLLPEHVMVVTAAGDFQ